MPKLNFALLLATLISVGDIKSYAHAIEITNADGVTIYYNFTNNKTELEVTYKGDSYKNADYAGKVVIPKSVTYAGKSYPVTSIGDSAFEGCSGLTSVAIPNSVTTINKYAFILCNHPFNLCASNSSLSFRLIFFFASAAEWASCFTLF